MLKHLLVFSILLWSCYKTTGNEIAENKDNGNKVTNLKDSSSIISPEFYLYIGTYTDNGSTGIYLANFDAESGIVSEPVEVAALNNASFQTISADHSKLWSVSEAGGTGKVVGYKIDPANGSLSQLYSYNTEGSGPCYVSYHNKSNSVLAANYGSGNVVRVSDKGIAHIHQHEGNGPNVSRQKGPHAHCFKIDINEQYGYSCDLGTDKVYAYDLLTEGLTIHAEIDVAAGAGPRHLDFHPKMKAMSVVNELNSTIEVFLPDENGCFTQKLTTISTIPDSHTTNNQCADIHYSPDGKYLYASNRGHNSIVCYKVDPDSMELELVGWMQETIKWPRNFTIDPSGRFLLVANQDANSITVFEMNQTEGTLRYTGNNISLSKPVCLNLLEKK